MQNREGEDIMKGQGRGGSVGKEREKKKGER
jgi:hypothetical protein